MTFGSRKKAKEVCLLFVSILGDAKKDDLEFQGDLREKIVHFLGVTVCLTQNPPTNVIFIYFVRLPVCLSLQKRVVVELVKMT